MVISIRLFSIMQLELQTPETMKKKINRQNKKMEKIYQVLKELKKF